MPKLQFLASQNRSTKLYKRYDAACFKKEQCAKKKEELSISGYMYAHNHKKEMQVIGESTNR
jgi:hypothetical protein